MWKLINLLLLACVCGALSASEVAPRHSTGGTVGPNGIKERVAFRLNKTKPNKDMLSILVDLGDHKFTSVADDRFKNRIVKLTIGTQVIEFQTDESAQVKTDTTKLKLIQTGAGLRIDMKKSSFPTLLSELMGRSGDVDIQMTITENHLPATMSTQAVEPRHEQSLYTKLLGLKVKENRTTLTGKG